MIKKFISKKDTELFLIFLNWRLVITVIGSLSAFIVVLSHRFLGDGFGHFPFADFFWPWANFDGSHYLNISLRGYGYLEYAFFPLYPLLISIFSFIIKNQLVSSLLISNVAGFVLLILLDRLWSSELSRTDRMRALFLLLCFPTAFFLISAYTESLFLCLIVGSFLAAKKGYFWISFLLGALACGTRLVGVFLIPSLFIIWFKDNKKIKDLIPILLIFLGLIIVLLFDFLKTGDPLIFIHVQPMFGAQRSGTKLILPPQTLFRYLRILTTVNPLTLGYFVAIQEFLVTIFAFVLLFLSFKKIKFYYWIYSLGVLLTPTLTGTLSSMPRYFLVAFPLFIFVSQSLKNRYIYLILIIFLVTLQIINISLFVNGYFVS